jgi:hypothetical protein
MWVACRGFFPVTPSKNIALIFERRREMKTICLAVLAILVAVGSASATTITQTQTFSGIPNYTAPLTFNKFNPSLGTLLSVQVLVGLTVDGGTLILDNDATSSASGTFQFGAKGDIASVDVPLLNSSNQPVTAEIQAFYSNTFNLNGNVGDGLGDYSPLAPDGMQYNGGPQSDNKNGFIGNFFLSSYIGTGTFIVNAAADQWSNYGSVSGVEYAVSPVSSNGSVQVVYNYNPIPEPATMALLGLGFMLFRRK